MTHFCAELSLPRFAEASALDGPFVVALDRIARTDMRDMCGSQYDVCTPAEVASGGGSSARRSERWLVTLPMLQQPRP